MYDLEIKLFSSSNFPSFKNSLNKILDSEKLIDLYDVIYMGVVEKVNIKYYI